MNQQHQGSGSSNPSSVPVKRKRGRPRKEESSAAQGDNTPVRRGSDNIVNSSQTEVTTGGADNEMLGKVVTGVIEGSFGAGYLLNVRVGDTQTYLKGAVFLPGRYDPVTPENDVAPHLKMLERKEFPIPVLNPQAQMQSSIPSSGQGSKQPVEPKLPVLNAQDQVLPSEIHSVTSVSLENQSDSVALPVANKPKNDTSISEGGIPQQLSEPGYVSQPPSIMSEMACDKVEQDVTLNKLDACRQVKEHGTDGGAEKDSEPTPEAMNLLPTTKIKDKELLTGQQAGSSLQMSNQQIQDEPKNANIKLNQMPVSAESESMQSEQIPDQINDSNILNQMSVTAEPVPMQSEQIHEEPKDPDIILNEMAVSSEPEPMQSEQTHDEPKNSDIIPHQMPITSEPEPKQSKQVNDEPKNSDIQLNQMPVSSEPESMKSEQIHDEPKKSNIQLNQKPLSAEPDEFMHSEHIDELKNSHIELNQMPVSAEPEPMQPVDKFVKQDSPKPAPETSDPTTLFEGVAACSESEFASEGSNLPTLLEGEAALSESKFASEGSNLPGINDPSGEITKEGDKQPNESFVKSVEPENPIGPDNL